MVADNSLFTEYDGNASIVAIMIYAVCVITETNMFSDTVFPELPLQVVKGWYSPLVNERGPALHER